MQLPGIIVAYRTPGRGSEDIYALNALEYLLFHGKSSRLYQRLVSRAAGGRFDRRILPAHRSVLVLDPGFGEAGNRRRKTARRDLRRAGGSPGAAGRRGRAAQRIRAIEVHEHLFGQESNEEMAQSLGASATRGTWREYLDWVESHRRLTPADLQRAARDVFTETDGR
ncbi:MAG: insulinase family protein [Candidatus Eisenbacteria bacterium]